LHRAVGYILTLIGYSSQDSEILKVKYQDNGMRQTELTEFSKMIYLQSHIPIAIVGSSFFDLGSQSLNNSPN